MKPFNLAEALAGAPVCTRDGRKVLELHLYAALLPTNKFPLGAVLEGSDGDDGPFALHYREDGTRLGPVDEPIESRTDLFMASTKHTIYLNIYREPDGRAYGYQSQEEAERFAGGNALAIAIPVEVEY